MSFFPHVRWCRDFLIFSVFVTSSCLSVILYHYIIPNSVRFLHLFCLLSLNFLLSSLCCHSSLRRTRANRRNLLYLIFLLDWLIFILWCSHCLCRHPHFWRIHFILEPAFLVYRLTGLTTIGLDNLSAYFLVTQHATNFSQFNHAEFHVLLLCTFHSCLDVWSRGLEFMWSLIWFGLLIYIFPPFKSCILDFILLMSILIRSTWSSFLFFPAPLPLFQHIIITFSTRFAQNDIVCK